MRDRRLPIFGWNCDLPNTVWIFLHGQFFSVPVIYFRISRLQCTLTEVRGLTKITNKECLRCIGGPFPVYYVVVCVDIESEFLSSLIRMSLCSMGGGGGIALTLLNCSRLPSDSLMADIQSCALLNRFFKDSLNGDSHGSSLITPA